MTGHPVIGKYHPKSEKVGTVLYVEIEIKNEDND